MKSYAKAFLLAIFAILFLSALTAADTSAAHPAYLHALANLRQARAHLSIEDPNMLSADEQRAIDEIDAAIRDVKGASTDDGKSPDDHPPVDTHGGRTDRLHRALELMDNADVDIDQRQQDSFWKGLKANSALHHVDEAKKAIHHAIGAERHE